MPTDRNTENEPTGDRPPAGYDALDLESAARRLGISANAVNQRRKRGTIYAKKDGDRWLYWCPPAGTNGRSADATGGTTAAGRRPGGIDVSRLVNDLIRENGDLKISAALWQERHAVALERLADAERRADLAERRLMALGQPTAREEATGDVIAIPPVSSMATPGKDGAAGDAPERTGRLWRLLRRG